MTDSLLLTLDTSGSRLSMGLYQAGQEVKAVKTLAEKTLSSDSQRYHSAIILPELTDLFQQAGKTVKDLQTLAIHIGPGSFTGIRTGLISARTLGQFLPVQTYAINAFAIAVFAASQKYPDQPVCIALDARRGRAYAACGIYGNSDFQWLLPAGLYPIETLLANQTNTPIIGSASLADSLPLAQSLESLYEQTPASAFIATLLQQNAKPFKRSWEALIPLYLEEPNITLPKRNPAIIQTTPQVKQQP